ncbi:trichohyalin-plectin-homology domain domain-containing protein [Kineosporia babensis]|uniref:Trichohyalin-plectin-homology domain domain-containing protein n=1 Tax=Kineosporia babensis TaxID=499548 RepID=A0A9X1NAX4_9ACTN|nr:trichohyalin-plectin-homology domain domain-containing protein [Kineosporia babensis]MCD5310365.1 trichohyalin-plectin-homology domain domain-containing protein [Kineosporia babensis]
MATQLNPSAMEEILYYLTGIRPSAVSPAVLDGASQILAEGGRKTQSELIPALHTSVRNVRGRMLGETAEAFAVAAGMYVSSGPKLLVAAADILLDLARYLKTMGFEVRKLNAVIRWVLIFMLAQYLWAYYEMVYNPPGAAARIAATHAAARIITAKAVGKILLSAMAGTVLTEVGAEFMAQLEVVLGAGGKFDIKALGQAGMGGLIAAGAGLAIAVPGAIGLSKVAGSMLKAHGINGGLGHYIGLAAAQLPAGLGGEMVGEILANGALSGQWKIEGAGTVTASLADGAGSTTAGALGLATLNMTKGNGVNVPALLMKGPSVQPSSKDPVSTGKAETLVQPEIPEQLPPVTANSQLGSWARSESAVGESTVQTDALNQQLAALYAARAAYLADCLARLRELNQMLYGPTSAHTVDNALTPELLTAQNLGAETWDRLGSSWDPVKQTLLEAGPGATAFVYSKAPGQPQHAFAFRNVEGSVVPLELQSPAGGFVLGPDAVPRVPVEARAIIKGPDGALIRLPDDLGPVTTAAALTLPATSATPGMAAHPEPEVLHRRYPQMPEHPRGRVPEFPLDLTQHPAVPMDMRQYQRNWLGDLSRAGDLTTPAATAQAARDRVQLLPEKQQATVLAAADKVIARQVVLPDATDVEQTARSATLSNADLRYQVADVLMVTAGKEKAAGELDASYVVADFYDQEKRRLTDPAEIPAVPANDGIVSREPVRNEPATSPADNRPLVVAPPSPLSPAAPHAVGTPRGALPNVDALAAAITTGVQERGGKLGHDDVENLPGRLLGAYRNLNTGYWFNLGGIDVMVDIRPDNPRLIDKAEGVYRRADGSGGPGDSAAIKDPNDAPGQFRANQNTQGAFNTGGHVQATSGQAGAFRVTGTFGAVFAGVARMGMSVFGTVNQVNISTSAPKDVESGRVLDYRDDSTMVAYDANYTVRFRTRPNDSWTDIPPSWSTDSTRPGPDGRVVPTSEDLLVYVPSDLLRNPLSEKVIAVAPESGPLAAEFEARSKEFPDYYFASGMDGLDTVYDRTMQALNGPGGMKLAVDSPEALQLQVMMGAWPDNMIEATSGSRPYEYLIHDKRGEVVAKVIGRSEYLPSQATPLGMVSEKMHIERVRTAIVGFGGSQSVTNVAGGNVSLAADALPLPGATLGPSFRVGMSGADGDSLSAGKVAVQPDVSRYTGPVNSYAVPVRHRTEIHLVGKPNRSVLNTDWVAGSAFVATPQWQAFAHGFPVDRSSLRPGFAVENGTVEFHPDAVPDRRNPPVPVVDKGKRLETIYEEEPVSSRPPVPVPPVAKMDLPAHILEGRGADSAQVAVNREAAEAVYQQVMTEAGFSGLVDVLWERPLDQRPAGGAPSRRLTRKLNVSSTHRSRNAQTIRKFTTQYALEALDNNVVTDGGQFMLRGTTPMGVSRLARVTVVGESRLDAQAEYPAREVDTMSSVFLSISSTSAGHGTSGSRTVTSGLRVNAGVDLMQMFGAGMDLSRTAAAGQSATTIGNRVELNESKDLKLVEHVLPVVYRVRIDYADLPNGPAEWLRHRTTRPIEKIRQMDILKNRTSELARQLSRRMAAARGTATGFLLRSPHSSVSPDLLALQAPTQPDRPLAEQLQEKRREQIRQAKARIQEVAAKAQNRHESQEKSRQLAADARQARRERDAQRKVLGRAEKAYEKAQNNGRVVFLGGTEAQKSLAEQGINETRRQLTEARERFETLNEKAQLANRAARESVAAIAPDAHRFTWTGPPIPGTRTVARVPGLGLPEFDPRAVSESGLPKTDPNVLELALIHHVDTAGLLPAARSLFPELTRPGGPADELVANMASAVMMRSYFKESVRGEYETGLLFDPGFLSDEHAGLGIAAELGPSLYAGVTDGEYVAGDIKLYLKQHGDSRAIQNEWALSTGFRMGDSIGDGDVALGALSAEEGAVYRDTRRKGTSMGRTGGKELLHLDFHRAYGFMAPVTYHLDGVQEHRGKFRPNRVDQAATTVGPRSMMYILPEPKALAAYGRGQVPINADQVRDALWRWDQGQLGTLDDSLITSVLDRLERQIHHAPGDLDVSATQREIDGYRAKAGQHGLEAHLRRIGRTKDDLVLPEYLTRGGPKSMGHHGIQALTIYPRSDTPAEATSMVDVLWDALDRSSPGLVGPRHTRWKEIDPNDTWYRRMAGDKPVLGRQLIGMDWITSLASAQREHAMAGDLMSEHGDQHQLANPVNAVLEDILEMTLDLKLTSAPEIVGFLDQHGIENYDHAQAVDNWSWARTRSGGLTLLKPGFGGTGPTSGTSGAPQIDLQASQRNEITRTDVVVEEQTAYDWSGHYVVKVRGELGAGTNRTKQAGRSLNNLLLHKFQMPQNQKGPHRTEYDVEMEILIPRSIVEGQQRADAADAARLAPLPPLPRDVYVAETFLDDLTPAAWELAGQMFGPDANDRDTRSSASLPNALNRTMLRNHLHKATGGQRHQLARNQFVPGRSGEQASYFLTGQLHHLQQVAYLPNGKGTGRYAKHQIGVTANSETGLWRPTTTAAAGQAGEVIGHISADRQLENPGLGGGSQPVTPHTPDDSQSGASTLDGAGGTVVNRTTAQGEGARDTVNIRDEQHQKQSQGPVVLVKAVFKGHLEGELAERGVFLETHAQRFRSDRVVGDVYVEMFEQEYRTYKQQAEQLATQAQDHPLPVGPWPVAGPRTPAYAFDKLLTDAGWGTKQDHEVAHPIARYVQAHARSSHLVLNSSAAHQSFDRYRGAVSWALGQLEADHPDRARVLQEQDAAMRWTLQQALLNNRSPSAGDLDTIEQSIEDLVNIVREVRPGAALPGHLGAAARDPLAVAQVVAQDLNRSIELRYSDAQGQVIVHRIAADGRVLASEIRPGTSNAAREPMIRFTADGVPVPLV